MAINKSQYPFSFIKPHQIIITVIAEVLIRIKRPCLQKKQEWFPGNLIFSQLSNFRGVSKLGLRLIKLIIWPFSLISLWIRFNRLNLFQVVLCSCWSKLNSTLSLRRLCMDCLLCMACLLSMAYLLCMAFLLCMAYLLCMACWLCMSGCLTIGRNLLWVCLVRFLAF